MFKIVRTPLVLSEKCLVKPEQRVIDLEDIIYPVDDVIFYYKVEIQRI